MLIVSKITGDIYYEGIDAGDCQNNMPKNGINYIIMPTEMYDEYIEFLQNAYENQKEIAE